MVLGIFQMVLSAHFRRSRRVRGQLFDSLHLVSEAAVPAPPMFVDRVPVKPLTSVFFVIKN